MSESEKRPVIVAGVGELSGNDPALLAAADIAQGADAELHLVHAYELPRLFSMAPGLEIAFAEGSDAYHDNVLGLLQGAAALEPGAEKAVCHVLEGSPGACTLQVAQRAGADLVVVGATRGSRLRRAFLGSTAQRVLRESRTPVLVARGRAVRPLNRVLVASDLTEFGAAVHERALSLAEVILGTPASVHALYVLPWSLVPPLEDTAAILQTARDRLQAYLNERRARSYPVAAAIRAGVPAEQIVAEAREWNADLVVVGTHARGWGARLLLGSVAEAALRDAPCSVLAVPPVRTGSAEEVGEQVPEQEPSGWEGAVAVI
ncbi:MAG TPA: universal stress protein [Longimicrobium sp.]|nr:universal stress protein [Longimicrobium sp.]